MSNKVSTLKGFLSYESDISQEKAEGGRVRGPLEMHLNDVLYNSAYFVLKMLICPMDTFKIIIIKFLKPCLGITSFFDIVD